MVEQRIEDMRLCLGIESGKGIIQYDQLGFTSLYGTSQIDAPLLPTTQTRSQTTIACTKRSQVMLESTRFQHRLVPLGSNTSELTKVMLDMTGMVPWAQSPRGAQAIKRVLGPAREILELVPSTTLVSPNDVLSKVDLPHDRRLDLMAKPG